jgi:predicted ATPase
MLTSLTVRNFKRLDDVTIELTQPVVFIGPNNSGKTTALQALSLWETGLRTWRSKRSGPAKPSKRPGVVFNVNDLVNVPIPAASLLWRDLHTRNTTRANPDEKFKTNNVRIDVIVTGENPTGGEWSCGFEFDLLNQESISCRPIREAGQERSAIGETTFTEVPDASAGVKIAFLPPMSGLADREYLKQPGEIATLIGQGQTAHVLRNLCYAVANRNGDSWHSIVETTQRFFGLSLTKPQFLPERGELRLEYVQRRSTLDITAAGRGFQQTLLLLCHLHLHPGTVLLLDEPDAHLEVLRQRQLFEAICRTASDLKSQIVAASHSEVVMNEAAGRGKVIAFVGKPHTLNNHPGQVAKSLTSIGWDKYYQAEQMGWVLFVEGPTDLSILKAFAVRLNHAAAALIDRPFVDYIGHNQPQPAKQVFDGLKEAKGDLVAYCLFDRLSPGAIFRHDDFVLDCWTRREIENYIAHPDVLLAWTQAEFADGLFAQSAVEAMKSSIDEVRASLSTLKDTDIDHPDLKASDDFLDPVFRTFSRKLSIPLALRKNEYSRLVAHQPLDSISPEVTEKLDRLVAVARRAKPVGGFDQT